MPASVSSTTSSEAATLRGSTGQVLDNGRPIRLLSLDGGGIRGISSILILKEVMREINAGRSRHEKLQPWQVFDLIGGTSTGGIIAVMLGRLRMTLDECLKAYTQLAKTVFTPKRSKYDIFGRGMDFISANERYNSSKLEEVVKDIIRERTGSDSMPMYEPKDSACRVFVTTTNADENELVLLRSYDNEVWGSDDLSHQFKMWEALRATSAATTYFKEFRHGRSHYVDGALKSNNPVFETHKEAQDLWPGRETFLISIGTGTKPPVPLRGHIFKLARSMTKLVTETDDRWNQFSRGKKEMAEGDLLFRYSVTDMGGVDLGDHKQMPSVELSTTRYLHEAPTRRYVKTCAAKVIEIETTDYLALRKEQEALAKPGLTDEQKACLKTLHQAAPDYESQRLAIDKAVPGTCEWFLKHHKYADWLKSSSASMIWATANPGCGKSVLSSYLVDELGSHFGDSAVVCSFFFRDGDATRQHSHQALCSFLHQVFGFNTELVDVVTDDFARKDAMGFTTSVESLWQSLCAATKRLGQVKLICVLDALDECSESSRDRLADLLASTFSPPEGAMPPSNLKFIVTSRPWPSLEHRLRPLLSIRLRGENEGEALKQDIEKVIRYKLEELERTSALPKSMLIERDLPWDLLRNADQTFLWVSLVLDNIARMPSRRPSAIRKMVKSLPSGLDQLYKTAMADFEDKESSIRLLEIVLTARRALTVDEINIALSMSSNTISITHLEDDMEPNVEWTIKRLGGFFIRITNSTVFFVHKTARDFLRTISRAEKESSTPSISQLRGDSQLASACIRFLTLSGLPTRGMMPQNAEAWFLSNEAYLKSVPPWLRGFLQYAASFWSEHFEIEATSCETTRLQTLSKGLCKAETELFASWWPIYAQNDIIVGRDFYGLDGEQPKSSRKDNFRFRKDCWYAHYAAWKQNPAIVRGLIESGYCNIDDENEYEMPLLALVARRDTQGLIRLLIDRFTVGNQLLGNALVTALWHERWGIAETLLTKVVDVNATYRLGRREYPKSHTTPAHALLECGGPGGTRYRLIPILVDCGLIVNDDHLVKAASMGHKLSLKAMLERDSRELDDRLVGLQQAHDSASENGRPGCRELICEAANGRISLAADFTKGLDAAAKRWDDLAMGGMLSLGAKDPHGDVLRWACAYALDYMADLLLKKFKYPKEQLDRALNGYFDNMVMDDGAMKSKEHETARKALVTREFRIFKSFPVPGTFYGTLSIFQVMGEQGARISTDTFIKGFAVLMPMDEDSALFMINELHLLRDDPDFSEAHLLVLTCYWGKEEISRRILDSGANPNLRNGAGVTPIMAATASGNVKVVELLLSRGASTEPCNNGGVEDNTGPVAMEDEIATLWSFVTSAVGGGVDMGCPVSLAKKLGYEDIETALTKHRDE